jgi:hypothetical protein
MYIFLNDGNVSNTTAYVNAIENACRDLAFNFSCVAVFDKKGIVRQSDIDLLFNTMDLIYAYGAGRIILVRKNSDDSSFFQPDLLHFQVGFTVGNAGDVREAENILDQKRQSMIYPH